MGLTRIRKTSRAKRRPARRPLNALDAELARKLNSKPPTEEEILAVWRDDDYGKQAAAAKKEEEEVKKFRKNATWLTRREEESLWAASNKYSAWEEKFVRTVEALRAQKIHSAKDMAKHFSKVGFTTLGGIALDARLVSILRDQFRHEGKMHRPPGFATKPGATLEPKNKHIHKSYCTYQNASPPSGGKKSTVKPARPSRRGILKIIRTGTEQRLAGKRGQRSVKLCRVGLATGPPVYVR